MRQMEDAAHGGGGVATLSRRDPLGSVTWLRPRPSLVIVEPKLRPPALAPGHVPRPELVAHLERLARRRLTLVTALAGFGKTSLMVEWMGTTLEPVAWLSLDAGDADPARLWGHIAEAVRRASGGADDPDADEAAWPAEIAGRLLNRLARQDRGMVIVLDDCHTVEAALLAQQLTPFLMLLPDGVRMVVAGRRRPELPLSLLRARGQFGEIGADALRLRTAEAARMGPTAAGEREIEGGMRTTGGWPACLALALAPDGARHVREYVADEVLAHEDQDAVRFLELTAVLDELRGSACDDLLGAGDSLARLRALARTTPLVSTVNGAGTRFRCEPLLRAVLRERLAEADPERAAGLRARAASLSGAAVSAAEMRVLRLLPTALTLREIGERLYLSLNTVKTHTRSLHRKLGVSSRAEAVERARALGIL